MNFNLHVALSADRDSVEVSGTGALYRYVSTIRMYQSSDAAGKERYFFLSSPK
jgi:hypothetical protein